MHAQLRSAQLYTAQQRSTLPCRALHCGAVPCRAVLSFEHRGVPGIIRVVAYSFFCFFSFDFSRSPCFSPHANYTRTANQNVSPPTSTQHSTGQFALHRQLLALSFRYLHQIMGLLFLPPLWWFSCILPCASVAGCVSRPRSAALV